MRCFARVFKASACRVYSSDSAGIDPLTQSHRYVRGRFKKTVLRAVAALFRATTTAAFTGKKQNCGSCLIWAGWADAG
jgi:hypothetical protein